MAIRKNKQLYQFLHGINKIKEIDIEYLYDLGINSIKSYSKGKANPLQKDLEEKWYKNLENGSIDYSVYGDDRYIPELFACYKIYSSKYIKMLKKPSLENNISIMDEIGIPDGIVDLGCGPGLSTKDLKELFPNSVVYGTNLKDTLQYQYAEIIAQENNFKIVETIDEIKTNIDLVFASEFFEHLLDPCSYLEEVLSKIKPEYLIIANAFGSDAIGHFKYYEYNSEKISNKKIGKIFNNTLRKYGYETVKTGFWNNRPQYWRLLKY